MPGLSAAVGQGAPNQPADVAAVQQALLRHAAWLGPHPAPQVSGTMDAVTLQAILAFQQNAASLLKPDGVVSPHGFTLRQLERAEIVKPSHPVFGQPPLAHQPGTLGVSDFAEAARTLGCEAAGVQAVAQTETKRAAWDGQGRPTILYERHVFSKLTREAYDATHPDIANPVRGGYGNDDAQYPKLHRAAVLDEAAALQSASWGAFQIVGEYFGQAGFASVRDFVTAMMTSEAHQLAAFVAFIRASPKARHALQTRDWSTFARVYNGPDYKVNDYDKLIEAAYARLVSPRPAAAQRPVAEGRKEGLLF